MLFESTKKSDVHRREEEEKEEEEIQEEKEQKALRGQRAGVRFRRYDMIHLGELDEVFSVTFLC